MSAHAPRPQSEGLERRTVIKAAAWAAPVIATVVAVPAFGADSTAYDSPTAYLAGSVASTGTSASTRTASFTNIALSYNSAGSASDSGELTLTIRNDRTAFVRDQSDADLEAAFVAAGWTKIAVTAAISVFTHPAVSNGAVVTVPNITFTAPVGTSKPLIALVLSSDSDDVSGQGLSLS